MNLWEKLFSALGALLKKRSITIDMWVAQTGYTKPMAKWHYFSEEETKGLEDEFIAKLEKARHVAGVPFVITSGKRSADGNSTVGGVQDSSHVSGRAVDLRSQSSHTHFKIIEGAILAGIRRIGVYRNQEGSPSHIHLDDSDVLPQEVMWLGVSK